MTEKTKSLEKALANANQDQKLAVEKALSEANYPHCHAKELDLIEGLKLKESELRKTIKEMTEISNALEEALANANQDKKLAVRNALA